MGVVKREEGVLKLVRPGGVVERHRVPVLAGDVIAKNPRHCVTRPDVFTNPWIVVRPESILEPGNVFFIVPHRTLRSLIRTFTPPDSSHSHLHHQPAAPEQTQTKDEETQEKDEEEIEEKDITMLGIKSSPSPPLRRRSERRVRFEVVSRNNPPHRRSDSKERRRRAGSKDDHGDREEHIGCINIRPSCSHGSHDQESPRRSKSTVNKRFNHVAYSRRVYATDDETESGYESEIVRRALQRLNLHKRPPLKPSLRTRTGDDLRKKGTSDRRVRFLLPEEDCGSTQEWADAHPSNMLGR